MSAQGLPATPVEFWLRHKGTAWPMCGAGPCQMPAVLSLDVAAVMEPRCAHHLTKGRQYYFIDQIHIGTTISSTYGGGRR